MKKPIDFEAPNVNEESYGHEKNHANEKSANVAHQPERLLRLNQVLKLFPVSRSTWYSGVAKQIFPAPVQLSARSVAWIESEILALIASAASKRS
ncbi:helix-turn-helix transcriptional regulator [Limnohabitans parvus]|uniref:AlpA family transcriptional regulator n=1 Tax=Limnohabitans parvus II-B4 TaxID=1293052 RepID=A0A315EEU5_9BURK|nr:AlpA family phage regulatory protein [Limnohabitans parvus]PUE55669.1 hypothetical protein B9Z37_03765 [Limnohabitans parvus II-B4]